MAGFGSGRSSSRGGRSHSSGGFGSSNSSYRGSSYGGGSRNTFINYGHSGYGFSGNNAITGRIISLIASAIFFCIGMFLLFGSNLFYAKVDAVITSVEQKEDAYGIYYDYDIEYKYKNRTIKNQWEDDYYQDIGYEFVLYVNKDNPANFSFEKPYNLDTSLTGIGFVTVGGISFLVTTLSLLALIITKKTKKTDDTNYDSLDDNFPTDDLYY